MDDLREMGLVNGLKLTSEDFQPITAFQLSLKVSLTCTKRNRKPHLNYSLSPGHRCEPLHPSLLPRRHAVAGVRA